MSLPPGYLLVILGLAALAALALHALTWRNRLIRHPVTGRTRAWSTPWHAGGADRPARRHRGCRPL